MQIYMVQTGLKKTMQHCSPGDMCCSRKQQPESDVDDIDLLEKHNAHAGQDD